ncbi:MAG: hypothetical protein ACLQIB_00440 [Isosphaeraceae bacterium]
MRIVFGTGKPRKQPDDHGWAAVPSYTTGAISGVPPSAVGLGTGAGMCTTPGPGPNVTGPNSASWYCVIWLPQPKA